MANFETVGLIGPRSEQREPKEKKKDMWDQLKDGLDIANGVMGLAVNYNTIQKYRGDIAAQEDTRNRVLSPNQEVENLSKGMEAVQPGADGKFPPGAVEYKVRQGEDTALRAMVKSQKQEKPLMGWVTTRDAKGVEESVYSPLTEGMRAVKQPVPLRASPKTGGSGGGKASTPKAEAVPAAAVPGAEARPPVSDRLSKLNATEKQKLDNLSMGLQSVAGMRDALAKGDWVIHPVGDNDFTLNRRDFVESLGRMQSGGVIGKEEIGTFKDMAPTFGDSDEMKAKKLDKLEAELASRLQTLGFTPEEIIAQRQQGVRTEPAQGGGKGGQPSGNDPLVLQYMKAHNLQYGQAEAILMQRGYKPGG